MRGRVRACRDSGAECLHRERRAERVAAVGEDGSVPSAAENDMLLLCCASACAAAELPNFVTMSCTQQQSTYMHAHARTHGQH